NIGGMCMNYYKLNEPIVPLFGITMIMDRKTDWFITDCPKCKKIYDYGAEVKKGKVTKIFLLEGGENNG
ncbi:MAG: hypothetical protein PHE73_09280, partial [Sulfurovaceae bacterium]|nr:hypothetical protein [Sulfurovaceae bacterium]